MSSVTDSDSQYSSYYATFFADAVRIPSLKGQLEKDTSYWATFQTAHRITRKTSVPFLNGIKTMVRFHYFSAIAFFSERPAARDLMDKRAYIYSNRPRMVMLDELCHGNALSVWVTTGFSRPSQGNHTGNDVPWRSATSLRRSKISGNSPNWRAPGHFFETYLNDWAAFVRLSIASTVLRICYGHEIIHPDDPLLKIVQNALGSPRNGPYLVDLFPLLKYYPSWLPGSGFQKDAADARVISQPLRYIPYGIARSQMGTLPSQLPPDEDPEYSRQAGLIRDAAAGMYVAAMDSTVSSMFTFFAPNPNELDTVLGQDRLPTFEDRSSLPFIECIILEVLRWNVVTPIGIPHMVTEEDEYPGYRIPKGTTILGNTWHVAESEQSLVFTLFI
ncbi:Cytochrome P450 [Tylopilus felleus]